MALWKDTTPGTTGQTPVPPAKEFSREPERTNVAPLNPDTTKRHKERLEMKESVIASDLTIEGKIVGSGHVRIAGRFKGDVQVDGNLTIDTGANVDGQVRAQVVTVGGELKGNIENAKRVELLEGGIINGDVKAGSLTVAAGSRMRGQVEFGWEDDAAGKKGAIEAKGFGTAT
ncbi:MAG: polymer-forming cytoskeletal protein [Gammaproteobacteria bacterium]